MLLPPKNPAGSSGICRRTLLFYSGNSKLSPRRELFSLSLIDFRFMLHRLSQKQLVKLAPHMINGARASVIWIGLVPATLGEKGLDRYHLA